MLQFMQQPFEPPGNPVPFSLCVVVKWYWVVPPTDIERERTHQSLCQGVTDFDKASMRHAETQEKIALPAKEGRTEAMINNISAY